MGFVGEVYAIKSEELGSWRAELERLGFEIEDLSAKLTPHDRQTFVFVGVLTNGEKRRLIELQRSGRDYMLTVRFAGSDDEQYLAGTLGVRFPHA